MSIHTILEHHVGYSPTTNIEQAVVFETKFTGTFITDILQILIDCKAIGFGTYIYRISNHLMLMGTCTVTYLIYMFESFFFQIFVTGNQTQFISCFCPIQQNLTITEYLPRLIVGEEYTCIGSLGLYVLTNASTHTRITFITCTFCQTMNTTNFYLRTINILVFTWLRCSYTILVGIVIDTSLCFCSTISGKPRIAFIYTTLEIQFCTGHRFLHTTEVEIGTASRFHFTIIPKLPVIIKTYWLTCFFINDSRHFIKSHDFPCRLKSNAYVTRKTFTLRQHHTVPTMEQTCVGRSTGIRTILLNHDVLFCIRIQKDFSISFLFICTCMQFKSGILQVFTCIISILEKFLCFVCRHTHQTGRNSRTGNSSILIIFGDRTRI